MKIFHLWRVEGGRPLPQTLQVLWTCEALARAGAEVEVLVNAPPPDAAPTGDGALVERLRRAGVRISLLPPHRPTAGALFRAAVLRRALSDAPAVFYARRLDYAQQVLALRRRRHRVVVEWHELDFLRGEEGARQQARTRAERLWQEADGHVVVSRGLREVLEEALGPAPSPCQVLPNGAPTWGPPSPAAWRAAAGPRRIAVASLLRKEAERQEILAVAAALPPGWELHLFGPALGGGLPPSLVTRGVLPPEGLRAELAEMDVLWCPLADLEERRRWDSPLKVWEAMAMGRPLITRDLPAVREIVGEPPAAVLAVPEQLPAALAEMERDPSRALALAARAWALSQAWTWEERGRVLFEFLLKISR